MLEAQIFETKCNLHVLPAAWTSVNYEIARTVFIQKCSYSIECLCKEREFWVSDYFLSDLLPLRIMS